MKSLEVNSSVAIASPSLQDVRLVCRTRSRIGIHYLYYTAVACQTEPPFHSMLFPKSLFGSGLAELWASLVSRFLGGINLGVLPGQVQRLCLKRFGTHMMMDGQGANVAPAVDVGSGCECCYVCERPQGFGR